jgi:hypothetical protein
MDRLSSLRLTTRANLGAALRRLPNDLNETYERTLCELQRSSEDDSDFIVECAKVVLRWLTFGIYTCYVEDFLDAVAISASKTVDWRDSRITPIALLRLLPGMVQLSPKPKWDGVSTLPRNTHQVVLEHFSVREFMTSSYLTDSAASQFAVSEGLAHRSLAEACIAILYFTMSTDDSRTEAATPFFHYARFFWFTHLNQAEALQKSNMSDLEVIEHGVAMALPLMEIKLNQQQSGRSLEEECRVFENDLQAFFIWNTDAMRWGSWEQSRTSQAAEVWEAIPPSIMEARCQSPSQMYDSYP